MKAFLKFYGLVLWAGLGGVIMLSGLTRYGRPDPLEVFIGLAIAAPPIYLLFKRRAKTGS